MVCFVPCTPHVCENSWEQTASLCAHTQSSHFLSNDQDLALRAAAAVPIADVAKCVQPPLQELWHAGWQNWFIAVNSDP